MSLTSELSSIRSALSTAVGAAVSVILRDTLEYNAATGLYEVPSGNSVIIDLISGAPTQMLDNSNPILGNVLLQVAAWSQTGVTDALSLGNTVLTTMEANNYSMTGAPVLSTDGRYRGVTMTFELTAAYDSL